MTILFEAYQLNSGSFSLRRQPRLRAGSYPTAFLLRRQPMLAMTSTAVTHVDMSLRRPRRGLRMSDRQNVFLLHHSPELAMSGTAPVPSAAVFVLARQGHRLSMTTIITTHLEMSLHHHPRALLSDSPARFYLNRQPRLFMSDGHVSMDRTGFLLQQPIMFGSRSLGITVGLSDQIQAHDGAAVDFIHGLVDLITFHDAYAQMAQVLQSLSDGMSVTDIAQFIWEAGLVDHFVASAVPEGIAQLTVMLSDGFEVADDADALTILLAALSDGFYVNVTIGNADDDYTAWVMTPETKAMRSYTNFPFNSFVKIGSNFLGINANGIYKIGGDTDAGEQIRFAIRSGQMNFGSLEMKAIDKAYVGATTDGNLLLRVQGTTHRGVSLEQTYRMVPSVTGNARELRQQVGRAFRSVYWQFELANDVDGAAVEIINWHVLPVIFSGRLY